MIFIGTIKGIGYAILILLCLVLVMKLFIKNFRFDDEVSFLLMVSFGVSVVLMSICNYVKSSESKVLYAQAQLNNALAQTQGGSNQKSIMDYIDENLPKFSSKNQDGQLSSSELNTQVNKHANSTVRGLRIARYITLLIEIIIQVLIFMFIKNKFKNSTGGYGRGASYMSNGYYE
ncbi:MAG: hypothetical protein SNG27_01665 [Rikenellaceae bacterium]